MYLEVFIRNLFKILPLYMSKIQLRDNFSVIEIKPIISCDSNYIMFLLKNLIIFQFRTIIDLVGLDQKLTFLRYGLIYNLVSFRNYLRLLISFYLSNNHLLIESTTNVFAGAGWLERECWDMFGIYFVGNKDLRRILTDYGFEGFPLRKDFPLTGFIEVRYDDEQRVVLYEDVELTQEFRFFDFESPWDKYLVKNE